MPILPPNLVGNGHSKVFASLDSETATTVTTAGTYYPVEGAFTNNPIDGFGLTTVDGKGAIEYLGDDPDWFEIILVGAAKCNVNGTTMRLSVKVNGVVCTRCNIPNYMKTFDEYFHISTLTEVELSKGSTVQLVITTDGDNDVITFNSLVARIKNF